MGTRMFVVLAFSWIAGSCNGAGLGVAPTYDIEGQVYQTLLDRIEQLETKVERHDVALDRIESLEKIVEGHPAELEAVRVELESKMQELQQLHADEISNLKYKFDADLYALRHGNERHKAAKVPNVVDGTPYAHSDNIDNSTADISYTGATKRLHGDTEEKINGTERIASLSRHLGSNVQHKTRVRRFEGEMVVAFYATLYATTSHLGQHQNVKFDTVFTNIGNSYDKHTGVFRAPVSGVYVFSTTMVAEGTSDTHFALFRNSERLTVLWVHGSENSYDGRSNTIVVYLNQNDDVTLQHTDSDKSVHGYNHCSFSGFLLTQYDQSVIVGK